MSRQYFEGIKDPETIKFLLGNTHIDTFFKGIGEYKHMLINWLKYEPEITVFLKKGIYVYQNHFHCI